MLRLVVRPEAEADIAEAAVWYESRSLDLGYEFARAVDATLAEVLSAPERYPQVFAEIRRALLHRFPTRFSIAPDATVLRSLPASTLVGTLDVGGVVLTPNATL